MHILVTGATGFIGHHVIPHLLDRGHQVSIVTRDALRAQGFSWSKSVHTYVCDLHQAIDDTYNYFGRPDAVMHLAWSGLPHYTNQFHITENLPANLQFLQSLIESGLKHLLISGTCYEYGLQSGCLTEDTPAKPINPYGQAKNLLREALEQLQAQHHFSLQWARLFYTYGEGQNPNSLIAQLNQHIDSGAQSFKMSGGEQLRDYLPVEIIAERLVQLVDHAECDGIINICSGTPISVLSLVKQHLQKRKAHIQLETGYYPYSDQEPMAFWGDGSKFSSYCSTEEIAS